MATVLVCAVGGTARGDGPDYFYSYYKKPIPLELDFTEVMVGMEAPIGIDPGPLVLETTIIDIAGSSLFNSISPGIHVATNIGRDMWLGLMQE